MILTFVTKKTCYLFNFSSGHVANMKKTSFMHDLVEKSPFSVFRDSVRENPLSIDR